MDNKESSILGSFKKKLGENLATWIPISVAIVCIISCLLVIGYRPDFTEGIPIPILGINIPFVQPTTPTPTEMPLDASLITCEQDYIIQPDDWLSKIAEKFYGPDGRLAFWAIVKATNEIAVIDDSYPTITNPDVTPDVGSKLCIPSIEDAEKIMGELNEQ